MADEEQLIARWADAFLAICSDGTDPAAAADTMLTVAGMLVARHSGNEAARLALTAGLNFLARREQPEQGELH